MKMRHYFASNIRHYDPHKWQRNDHMRKLPVLSNAPLCALPKILQVNKPLQVTESPL